MGHGITLGWGLVVPPLVAW